MIDNGVEDSAEFLIKVQDKFYITENKDVGNVDFTRMKLNLT